MMDGGKMKKIIMTIVALSLISGCVTNGQFDGKKTALLVSAMIIAGVALSNNDSSVPEDKCVDIISYPSDSPVTVPRC